MLRLDVDAGDPYAVPPDNPFVGQADARPEIWALGLRNPWRFAFDREAGLLYVADVGQREWEEVSVVPASQGGANFGWDVMEGTHCYEAAACDRDGLVIPALEYSHAGENCSVTGGHVYRGSGIPGLRGWYLYADLCAGWIRAFRHEDGEALGDRELDLPDIGRISAFGEDAAGELYVVSLEGSVYRFREAQAQ
jgi:glucose/arabinose dehydrogenase